MTRAGATRRAAVVASVVWLAASCGSAVEAPPFRLLFPDNRAGSIEALLARVPDPAAGAPMNAAGVPVLVVASHGQVSAHDVSRDRRLWQAEIEATSRPFVTEDAVIFLAGDDVVALALESGRFLWRFPREEQFLGAAATYELAFLVFGAAPGRRASALVAVDMETGAQRWRIEVEREIGAPAVAGDLVLVPWDHLYVSAFAAQSGVEVARMRSLDDRISFVTARREGIFYGGRTLYRLTSRSARGTKRGQTRFELPEPVALPGEPTMGPDAFLPMSPDAARHPAQIFWAPGVSDLADLPLSGELVYSLHRRIVFGIAHADGAVRWATELSEDAIAACATEGGLLLVDAAGALQFIDASDGLVRYRSTVAAPPILSASFDLGILRPHPNVRPESSSARARLVEIATGGDGGLVDVRAFATRLLGRLPGPQASADLVRIIAHAGLPQAIREAAAASLEGRSEGTEALIAALGTHRDWLARTEPGPVAALAAALASVREARAVPALLEHLDDPSTDPETLAAIARALGEIGDHAAQGPLFTFLERYHADDALGFRPPALAEAAQAILRLGGRDARPRLEAIAADPNGLAFVRDATREILAGPDPVPSAPLPAPPAPPPTPP
ncbi:MAG: PQQ-binding-like beta-propeller repeat protein [Deltaproteobacteria bacterium]|nr:PQQ-binding-like beta-propeller repeat protein [Deltaproteobacteria bacterium]